MTFSRFFKLKIFPILKYKKALVFKEKNLTEEIINRWHGDTYWCIMYQWTIL